MAGQTYKVDLTYSYFRGRECSCGKAGCLYRAVAFYTVKERIGQQRNVEVIKLITENSIEQRVIELQQLKKDVADRMIAGDDSSITGASLEDIAFILRQ